MAARLADRAHLRLRWLAAFLAAGLIAPPSLGAKNAANTSSGVVYCCKDADGQRICSDKLPHACYGRAYIIMKQGVVLQSVEAPLTPAERRQRAAEAAARKKEEQERRMQEWKDRSLLETYPTPEDLDAAERAELGKIDLQLDEARKRKVLLNAQITEYEQDVEAGKTPNVSTRVAVDAARGEVQRLDKAIQFREGERKALQQDFAEKRTRYLELLEKREQEKRNAPKDHE